MKVWRKNKREKRQRKKELVLFEVGRGKIEIAKEDEEEKNERGKRKVYDMNCRKRE